MTDKPEPYDAWVCLGTWWAEMAYEMLQHPEVIAAITRIDKSVVVGDHSDFGPLTWTDVAEKLAGVLFEHFQTFSLAETEAVERFFREMRATREHRDVTCFHEFRFPPIDYEAAQLERPKHKVCAKCGINEVDDRHTGLDGSDPEVL